MLEEVAFSYITRQDSKLDLSELDRVTLSGLITATVATMLNIPYAIPDEFSYNEVFSDALAESFHIFLECTRYIMNEINKISFI